ncbi:MAG: hypothetical protein HZB57_00470 [Gammaproteobacteria bacterium]|nr:hypothetical protein [Gammaproteobacteria bacterium]
MRRISSPSLTTTEHKREVYMKLKQIEEEWLVEAQRRARELDAGIVQPIQADEVRRKARALLEIASLQSQ